MDFRYDTEGGALTNVGGTMHGKMQYGPMAPIFWAKSAVALVALAASIPAVRLLVEPLKKLLSDKPAWELANLVGWVGVTDVDKVTTTFGWANVRRGDREDQHHLVEVRARTGIITPRGCKVLLEEFNPEERYFWVVKIDENLEQQQIQTGAPEENGDVVEEQ